MASSTKVYPERGSKLTLGFGLVSVPVRLKPLTESTRPISGKGMCPTHGVLPPGHGQTVCGRGTDHEHVLDSDEKVLGYPHPNDPTRYVVVDPDVVKSLKEPRSGTAAIEAVVDVEKIDPGYLGKAYLVWPGEGGDQAFGLFAGLLRGKGMSAVCTAVLSQQTQTVLFRWSEHFGCVLAHVVQFDSMIRNREAAQVRQAAEEADPPDPKMMEVAGMLFDQLAAEFVPSESTDRITPRMQEAIIAADDGTVYEIDVDEVVPTSAGDLMAALQASVAAVDPVKKPAARKAKPKPKAKVPA